MGAPRSNAWLAWAWRIQWGRNLLFEPSALAGSIHNSPHLADIEVPTLLATENGIGGQCPAPQTEQQNPGSRLQQNGPRLAAFPEHGDLPGHFLALLCPLHGVAPFQLGEFRDPGAGGIKQAKDHLIAAVGRPLDQAGDIAFSQDPLGQSVAVGPELQGGSDVEREVPGGLPKREERLDSGKGAVLAGGLQFLGVEPAGEVCKSESETAAKGFATKGKKRESSKR